MSSPADWETPSGAQPKAQDYSFDLDRALSSVLGVRASVPEDAFTAGTLGTERAGNGVVIDAKGVVLTIGYLVTEAETLWLNTIDGRAVPGHVLAYDQETGFGLVQALGKLDLPALPIGESQAVRVGDKVVVAGAGGPQRAVAAQIAAKQEFAGYWEYLLDEALFTAPAHPNWGGTAVIDSSGKLIGIGSLHLQQARDNGPAEHLNMIVPIALLGPILGDLLTLGRPNHPPRPWLGLYATEIDGKVVVAGMAANAPARRANLKTGDIVMSVAGKDIGDLATLYRSIWSLGAAGVEVPVTVYRDGKVLPINLRSADRASFLKKASLH
ncbi:MAG TPA: S1C family serine protease [Stellaceae bacterium]|jgi:S1-C subfamily serine protease|nr:S1C family serine protease [Stellaceae bacterium]